MSKLDNYYYRNYGIFEKDYNDRLVWQGGICAICGSTPKKRRLHVDHDHKVNRVKIQVERTIHAPGIIFMAKAVYHDKEFWAAGPNRSEAKFRVRKMLLKESIRGIICFPCNRGIRVFFDDPKRLRAGADYLEKWQNGEADSTEVPAVRGN